MPLEGALIFGGLVAVMLTLVVTGLHLVQRGRRRAFQRVAQTFGLTVEHRVSEFATDARGTVDGVPVVLSFRTTPSPNSKPYTEIIASEPLLPSEISLLDTTAFDPPTRARIEAAVAVGVGIRWGKVTWYVQEEVRDVPRLEQAMRLVVEVARILEGPEMRPHLLAALQRVNDFDTMKHHLDAWRGRWQLTEAEEDAMLAHQRPSVRLAVAPLVGQQVKDKRQRAARIERAWAVVVDVFDRVDQPAATRIRAIEALQHIDQARAVPFARDRIQRTQPTEVMVALVGLLTVTRSCPPLAELADLLALRSEPLRIALARCLEHSTENAESQLLELLADSDDDVAAAAAQALAHQGSLAAVAPLTQRADGFLTKLVLKRAAAATLAALQARVGSHLVGSLALPRTEGADGALSVPKSEDEKHV